MEVAIESAPIVLDSSALVALLRAESGADLVADLLADAEATGRPLLMHRLHLGEVYTLKLRADGEEDANQLLEGIRSLPISISDVFDQRLMRTAAGFKVRHRLSYLDAIAGAWAAINRAVLATGDRRAFLPLERAGAIQVRWIR